MPFNALLKIFLAIKYALHIDKKIGGKVENEHSIQCRSNRSDRVINYSGFVFINIYIIF